MRDIEEGRERNKRVEGRSRRAVSQEDDGHVYKKKIERTIGKKRETQEN